MNKKLSIFVAAFALSMTLLSCNNNNSTSVETSPSVVEPSINTAPSVPPSTSTSVSIPNSDDITDPSVVIPDGMVAVNFRYNYGKNYCFKIVPYNVGDKIQKPSLFDQPERSGYVFMGWYEDRFCTTPFDFDNTLVPEGGIDIYANWTVFDADPVGDQAIEDNYETKAYTITYTSGVGFSYINPNGALLKTANAGDIIEFKLAIGTDYEGTPIVKANDTTIEEENGLYRHVVNGNTTFTVSGITKINGQDDDDKNFVSWYICGTGSLWEADDWSISDGVQLYENPDNPEDKGQYLGITFAVGDIFKITNGSQWFGYEMIDPWDDSANAGRSCFVPDSDGFGGNNIKCSVAGTYDIYVNGSGNLWIQVSAQ